MIDKTIPCYNRGELHSIASNAFFQCRSKAMLAELETNG